MRYDLALLLSAAAFVSPVGCLAVGGGGGWADNWSVPAPMQEPDRYTGLDFSSTPIIPTFGLYHLFDSDESFTVPYVTYDLGMVVWLGVLEGSDRCWPVFKPLIGRWDWSQSPEDTGLLTGLKLGAGVRLSDVLCLTFEYGWLKAHDAVGDHDARFQTATGGIFMVIPQWIPERERLVSVLDD